ncbi:hypothetical protein VZ94_16370 [Methylocucumis oryzae]|uniref:Response regulatory domain-containing protein n=2 Tax=Methylocucumis oryzae TaxID=1632867 RepID=A0A0F3IFW0_9GAMM|nr:hypothetical protein VZ94_16370 [Methylocucumis oryzae]
MKLKILIVDDNPNIRQLVAITMESLDCELAEASSADEAIKLLDNFKPVLIFLDVMMPGTMNGYDLCKHLKSTPRYDSIKIILLTARGQKCDIEEGVKAKCDSYMVKPFSPLDLLEQTKAILRDSTTI